MSFEKWSKKECGRMDGRWRRWKADERKKGKLFWKKCWVEVLKLRWGKSEAMRWSYMFMFIFMYWECGNVKLKLGKCRGMDSRKKSFWEAGFVACYGGEWIMYDFWIWLSVCFIVFTELVLLIDVSELLHIAMSFTDGLDVCGAQRAFYLTFFIPI